MHSREILFTKLHLSVKGHDMQVCYSETSFHLQKNSRSFSHVWNWSASRVSHFICDTKRREREIHYVFDMLAMQMSRLSLRSTYNSLALSTVTGEIMILYFTFTQWQKSMVLSSSNNLDNLVEQYGTIQKTNNQISLFSIVVLYYWICKFSENICALHILFFFSFS